MPDDHSKVVPLLPIPNRTVKRLSADDSADTRVKVGHCQALTAAKGPMRKRRAFCFLTATFIYVSIYASLLLGHWPCTAKAQTVTERVKAGKSAVLSSESNHDDTNFGGGR
jgi:hypothetical protein